MTFVPVALLTGLATAVLSMSPTIAPRSIYWPPAPDGIATLARIYAAGTVGAFLTWGCVRSLRITPSRINGVLVGSLAALLVHLLAAIAAFPASLLATQEPVATIVFYFAWGLLTVGWMSVPLGGLVGWLVARRWARIGGYAW